MRFLLHRLACLLYAPRYFCNGAIGTKSSGSSFSYPWFYYNDIIPSVSAKANYYFTISVLIPSQDAGEPCFK